MDTETLSNTLRLTSLSSTDHLSKLPVELLRRIFREVTVTYSAVVPLSKDLRAVLSEIRYERIDIGSYKMLGKLIQCVEANKDLGASVKELKIHPHSEDKGCWADGKRYATLRWTKGQLCDFFRTLRNLTSLSVAGKDLFFYVLSSPSHRGTPFLPFLSSLCLTFDHLPTDDLYAPKTWEDLPVAYPRLTSLSVHVFQGTCFRREDDYGSAEVRAPFEQITSLSFGNTLIKTGAADFLRLCTNLKTLALIEAEKPTFFRSLPSLLPNPSHLEELSLEGSGLEGFYSYDEWYGDDQPWLFDQTLAQLPSHRTLSLNVRLIDFSPSLFSTLRTLPLRSLELGPLSSVAATDLISLITEGPLKHPSLVKLVLNVIDDSEEDRTTSDEECDRLTGTLIEPNWTRQFSRRGMEQLVKAARAAGVKVTGTALEALKLFRRNDASQLTARRAVLRF